MLPTPPLALTENSDFVTACYIVAFSLFILGIRQGTHPRTARRGNLIAAGGMLVAIAITLKFLWDSFKWRYRPIIGLGVSLGAVMILQINLQPWYLLWAVIPLAASAGTSRFRVAATVISAALPFLLPPTGSTFDGRPYVLPFAYLAAVVVCGGGMLIVRRLAPVLLSRPSPPVPVRAEPVS